MAKELEFYINEEEIKEFNNYKILNDDGSFNKENYKKWFTDYLNKLPNDKKSLEALALQIKRANAIANRVIKNNNNQSDNLPLNGGLSDNELTELILLSMDPEILKKSLDELLTKLDDNKKISKEDIDNNKKKSLDKKNDKDNKDDDLKQKLLPIAPIVNLLNKDINPELKEKLKKIVDEYKEKTFKKNVDSKKLTSLIDEINKTYLRESKKRIEQANKLSASYKFNYDIWWNYIILRMNNRTSYLNLLFFKPEERKNEYPFVMSFHFQTGGYVSGSLTNLLDSMNEKYGLDIDLDILASQFEMMMGPDDYKGFFINQFRMLYKESDNKKDFNITDLLIDFDKMLNLASKDFDSNLYEKYGGLGFEDVNKLLTNCVKKELSVNNKINKEIKNLENTMSAKEVFTYLNNKFIENYNNNEADPEKHFNLMKEAMASYLCLKDLHDNRGTLYIIRHPYDYYQEGKAINSIETLMNNDTDKSKRDFISSINKNELYYERYNREMESISRLVNNIENEVRINLDLGHEVAERHAEREVNPVIDNSVNRSVEREASAQAPVLRPNQDDERRE